MSKLFLALILIGSAKADPPFWQAKEKVYERVQNREVIVSVKEVPAEPPLAKKLAVSGGGQLDTPCSFAFELSEDFAQVARESGYLEEVQFDRDKSVLSARISAYGYKADTEVELKSEKSESEPPFIRFLVQKGPLSGMKGRFTFFKAGKLGKKCDVGLDGHYGYDRFPLPQFFLRFGMEVIFQRMAGRLRAFAEGRYGKRESN